MTLPSSAACDEQAVRRGSRRAQAGFTLVEVLVALFVMALLAALAWQGLDSVLRSRDASRDAVDGAVRLATVLTQWEQDLLALYDSNQVPALSFDGQTLRLTRRNEAGVALVTWAVRGGRWQRWMSPAYTRVNELQEVWLRSQQFQGNEVGQLEVMPAASDWQIYFFRDSAWTNAQSTGNLRSAAGALPHVGVAAAAVPAAASAASAAAASSSASAPEGAANPVGGVAVAGAAAASAPDPGVASGTQEQLPSAVRLVITLDGRMLTRDIALAPSGS